MEEIKNSAIEKTENIANANTKKGEGERTRKPNNQTIRRDNKKRDVVSQVKRDTEREAKASDNTAKKDRKLENKKSEKLRKDEDKLRKKELKKQVKENKKAEKIKRAEAKKRRHAAALKKVEAERLKRKQRLKAEREERIKKRAERKELIKNESKQERKVRLEKERKLKLAARKRARETRLAKMEEKQKAKAAAIRAEKEARLAKKAERSRIKNEKRQAKLDKKGKVNRSRNSRRESKKGYGGWLAAVISLGCATIILSGLLTFSIFEPSKIQSGYNDQNARGFYDLVGCVDNIDVNLSKFMASNDDGIRQKLLGDVRVQSNLAVESLTSLAIEDESKYYTTKFINQTGDYSKFLSEKLMSGKSLTERDMSTIEEIYRTNKYIKESLAQLTGEIDENFDFSTVYEGKDDNIVIKRFKDLESKSVEYPHMVYDGAFADEVKSGTAESLNGEKEISELQATDIMKKCFSNLNIGEITLTGDINDEFLSGYNLTAVDVDGVEIDAQISKKGGKIINFNYYKECLGVNYGLEECEKIADEFLKKAGLKDMKAVWVLEDGANATINYAYELNGVICYSDLVKISVCRERGVVNGMDARNYYLNHKDRNLATPLIKEDDAENKLNENLVVQKSSLALIPQNGGVETLAYEFIASKEDGTYYVYIDALTGAEVDIFKVVETSEGTMLM